MNFDELIEASPKASCRRCGDEWAPGDLSRDWEECPNCTDLRDEWEANTPEWRKLGMSSPWEECL